MKRILLFCVLLNITNSFSQFTTEQESQLTSILLKKVNALRKQKGVHALEIDSVLKAPAKLQADYMSSKKTAVKTQEKELYQNTEKRVKYYNTSYDILAENIIKTRAIAPPLHAKKIVFIANITVNTWRKSPEAYQNIISNNFSYTNFGITYNEELKQFFISNVFGNKPYKVANQLSEHAFGIKENDISDYKYTDEENLTFDVVATNITIENNEVLLTLDDKKTLNSILTTANDGLAIDIISETQTLCGLPNKLDASSIYDGVLLKPIYRNDINFTINDSNKHQLNLGTVPDVLKNSNVKANLIVLKNNSIYKYINNTPIDKQSYKLLPLDIKLEIPYIDLQNQGIYLAKEILFDFNNSESTTDKYTEANFDLDNIHSFDIKSYTSIDGSERSNTILQNKRAEFIKKHIGNVLGHSLDFTKINIDAKENWSLYNYQLKLYGYRDMLTKSKTERRALANGKLKNSWVEQFGKQRKSKIIAFQHGYWNRNNKQHGFYNLLNGLITDNIHLVNKSLELLYKQEKVNYSLDKDFILDKLLTQKDLVQNVAALFSKNIKSYNIENIVYFIDYWLPKVESLSFDAQKNLLHLYTITTLETIRDWTPDNQILATLLHPKNVDLLFKVYKAKTTTNALFINYYITQLEYFNKVNKNHPNPEFDLILEDYNSYKTTNKEKFNLVNFYNAWNKLNISNTILKQQFEQQNFDSNLTFALSKLANLNSFKIDTKTQTEIHSKALELNKEKWCEWYHENFQNMTSNIIKKSYCKNCK